MKLRTILIVSAFTALLVISALDTITITLPWPFPPITVTVPKGYVPPATPIPRATPYYEIGKGVSNI